MKAIDESKSKIPLNLETVQFIDSSGLGAVISVKKHLGNGYKIDLCALTPTVEKFFRVARMDSIFAVYATPDMAFRIIKRKDSGLSNNLIRFQLRMSEDYDAVRIGLGKSMRSLKQQVHSMIWVDSTFFGRILKQHYITRWNR